MRKRGHDNSSPIILHKQIDGLWLVDEADVDRFAVAEKVAGEYIANLLRANVNFVPFELRIGSSDDDIDVWDALPRTAATIWLCEPTISQRQGGPVMSDVHSYPDAARIMVVYPDGWHAFALSDGTTFGELASRIEDLGAKHRDSAIEIKIRIGVKKLQTAVKSSPASLNCIIA